MFCKNYCFVAQNRLFYSIKTTLWNAKQWFLQPKNGFVVLCLNYLYKMKAILLYLKAHKNRKP